MDICQHVRGVRIAKVSLSQSYRITLFCVVVSVLCGVVVVWIRICTLFADAVMWTNQ